MARSAICSPARIEYVLTPASFGFLVRLAQDGSNDGFWRRRGVRQVDVFLQRGGSEPPDPEALLRDIDRVLGSFGETRLRLRNFPYCLLRENFFRYEYAVSNRSESGTVKPPLCSACKFTSGCAGLPTAYAALPQDGPAGIAAIPDRPLEIMIEVEPRCQMSCRLCFNQGTFAPDRSSAAQARLPTLTAGAIRGILDQMSGWGVPQVRFTGGEPLLRPDLAELMDYARERDIRVWVNTNGYSLQARPQAQALCARTDNVLLSLRGWDEQSDSGQSQVRDSFESTCAAARTLRACGLKTLRIGTYLTNTLIENIDKMRDVVAGLQAQRWELYRPVAFSGRAPEVDAEHLRALVDRLLDYRRTGAVNAFIANPLPFCFYDAERVSRVSLGAIMGEGNNRFVVDPRGFCKPIYYMDVDLGDSRDLRAAWDSPFSRAVRNLELLPSGCAGCFYMGKCRGGSRHAARQAFGDYRAPDPLATFRTVRSEP